MSALVRDLGALAVTATPFLAVALLLDSLLRRRASPHLRLALLGIAAAKLVTPTDLASPVSLAAWTGLAGGDAVAGSVTVVPAAAPSSVDVGDVAAVAWLIGAVVCALVPLLRARSLRRRPTAAADDRRLGPAIERAAATVGLRRGPRVAVSAGVSSAVVVGLLRPVVVLPATSGAWSDVELHHVLVHECAHVVRRDPLCRAVLLGFQAVFWFHPLVWLLVARLSSLLELFADGRVARALGGRTAAYRATLARHALVAARAPALAPALPFFGSSCHAVTRLLWLESRRWRPRPVRRTAGALVAAALGACVLPTGTVPRPLLQPATETSSARTPSDEAREILARYAAGDRGPGCVRLQYAALLLSVEAETRTEGSQVKGNEKP